MATAAAPHTMITKVIPIMRPVLGIVGASLSFTRIEQAVCTAWLIAAQDEEHRRYFIFMLIPFVATELSNRSFHCLYRIAAFSRFRNPGL